MRALLTTSGALALLFLSPAVIAAESTGAGDASGTDTEVPEADSGGGSVYVAFAGGMMMPRTSFAESREAGLTAGMALGFTTRSGLGLALSAEYAPLPPTSRGPGPASRETHVGSTSIAPRFTLGRGAIRGWIAAGGGLVIDYEEVELAAAELERRFTYEPVAAGAVGIELRAFDSGGLIFAGRYARSVPEPEYELITATAGLVLDF